MAHRLKSPEQPRGITYVEAGFTDVLGHDRASPDHDMITNGNREYSSVRPDTYTIAKLGLAPEAPFLRRAVGNKGIINKHRPVRNEAIVPDRDQLTDEGVRLNTAALTYLCFFLYLDEWPDEGAISNRASIEIDWLYDGDVFTKLNVDNPCVPNFWLCHKGAT